MIAVLSTSSPVVSLALFDPNRELVEEDRVEARHAASGVALDMLRKLLAKHGAELHEIGGFVADIGPGSFTGTRVGVTLIKSLAYAMGSRCGGLLAFRLFDGPAAVPYRKGTFFVQGQEGSIRTVEDPAGLIGYGDGFAEQIYPTASKAVRVLGGVEWLSPEQLMPAYCAEPSISAPKRAYGAP